MQTPGFPFWVGSYCPRSPALEGTLYQVSFSRDGADAVLLLCGWGHCPMSFVLVRDGGTIPGLLL